MGEFIQVQKYDSLAGRSVRDMRANDIVTVYTASTIGAVGSTFDSTSLLAVTSSHEVFVTNFWAITTASAEISIQHGTGNTATLCVFFIPANTPVSINTNLDTPIGKASAGGTLSIRAKAGQTACAWLSGVRVPVWDKVETA